MVNGVYSLRVVCGPLLSRGIVVLRDRCINGSDAERLYQGVFGQEGNRVAGELHVTDWMRDTGSRPVGLSAKSTRTLLTGTTDPSGFHMVGRMTNGSIMEIDGRRVADLVEPCELSLEIRLRLRAQQSEDLR